MVNPLYRILFACALFLSAQQVSAIDSIPAPKIDIEFDYKLLPGGFGPGQPERYGLYAYQKQTRELLGHAECSIIIYDGALTIQLDTLKVRPYHRNKGVGKQLFRQLCKIAVEHQFRRVIWLACPFESIIRQLLWHACPIELPYGMSWPAKFKRLRKFYESLGGTLASYNKPITERTVSAWMERSLPANEHAFDAEVGAHLPAVAT